MNRIKLNDLTLAILLLAALLSLFFAFRYGGVFGGNRVLPAAPPAVIPELKVVKPPSAPVDAASLKKRVRKERPEEKRKKRVSTLREPGEAFIGGISEDTVPVTGAAQKKGAGAK